MILKVLLGPVLAVLFCAICCPPPALSTGERRGVESNNGHVDDTTVRLLVVYWSVTNWTAALGAEVVRAFAY
jgi:hypothetical protein